MKLNKKHHYVMKTWTHCVSIIVKVAVAMNKVVAMQLHVQMLNRGGLV